MPLGSFLTNLFASKGSDLLNGVSNIIKDWKVTPEQQAVIEAEINRHNEAVISLGQQADKMYMSDLEDARNMQIEALKQNDNFAKRFIYWLALGVIVLTFAFDFSMIFFSVPPENKDLVNIVCGVLNTSCLVMIISFFYGSSKGSQDHAETINKMIANNDSK